MKFVRFTFVVSMLVFMATNVSAATTQAKKAQPYIGGKLGLMMPDASGVDDAVNLGILVGMTLNEVSAGSISVEGELTTTIVDGDTGGGDWDVTTLAGYGVFRSSGPLYFKGKAGLVYWDASIDAGPFGTYSDDDIDISFGVGGGFKISDKTALELEYTIIESDLDFLSLGFKMSL